MIHGLMKAASRRRNAGGSDPYWANVVLLMHMEGAEGSAVFVDEKGHPLTPQGTTTKLTTAYSAVGTSSMQVTPTGSVAQRVTTPDSSDFYLAGGDFTIEARVRLTQAGNPTYSSERFFLIQANAIADNANRQFGMGLSTTTGVGFYYTINGVTDINKRFATPVNLNTWYAVSVSRVGNVMYAHKDGVFLSSLPVADTFFNSTAPLSVGSFGNYAPAGYGALDWAGQIDELRITKGVGRYTNANYALAPFPNQ